MEKIIERLTMLLIKNKVKNFIVRTSHIMILYECSESTARKKLRQIKDTFGVEDLSVINLCKYLDVSFDEFQETLSKY